MSIFYSEELKKELYDVYDSFMEKLGIPYEDIYATTRYGKLHMVKTGDPNGKPLLIYPGFNVTAPFQLIFCDFFLKDYCCYGVDIIGHPGKSEERIVKGKRSVYGNMVNDALENMGLDSVYAFASSLECGMLSDLMAVAPKKVKKAVFYVPAIIKGNRFIQAKWFMYKKLGTFFNSERYLKKADFLMAQTDDYANDTERLAATTTLKCMKEALIYKLPRPKDVKECNAQSLLLMGELDKFFPQKMVLKAAPDILKNYESYVMKGRGHIGYMSEECKQYTLDFLAKPDFE